MPDPVNLRLARKRRARAEKERVAEENRVRFGRPKAEKETIARESERESRTLEGHRRQRPPTHEDR